MNVQRPVNESNRERSRRALGVSLRLLDLYRYFDKNQYLTNAIIFINCRMYRILQM